MQELFSPLSAEYLRDPWSVFQTLRDTAPCYWSEPANSWVVSRYEDCKQVLRENATFARDRSRAGAHTDSGRRSIQTEDPPSQLILRRRILKALHAQDMEGIASDSFDRLSAIIKSHRHGHPFNIVRDAIAPAAMNLVTRTLGVPGFDPAFYSQISEDLTRGMDAGFDHSRLEPGIAAGNKLRAGVQDWFGTPGKFGMLGTLAEDEIVQSELERKGERYLENTIGGVFNAGFSTTVAVTAALIELEQSQPGTTEAAFAAPDLNMAVNELLRFLSPAQATSRIALQDTTLSGSSVRKGDVIITLMASANHDERQFDEPERIDFTRSPNAHLSFAWGPHVCLGAQLATSWLSTLVRNHSDWLGLLEISEFDRLDSATLRTNKSITVRKAK